MNNEETDNEINNSQKEEASTKYDMDRLRPIEKTCSSSQGEDNPCIRLSAADLTASYDSQTTNQSQPINYHSVAPIYSDFYKQYLQRQKHSPKSEISKQSFSRSVQGYARPWTVFTHHHADEYNVKYQILCH